MFQMLTGVVFLGLILIPVFILFVTLYQNLLETAKPRQNIKPKRAVAKSNYTDSKELLSTKLRVVK